MRELSLSRFTIAHKSDFETAFREIKGGKKRSHWMWYIFPQIVGLGYSYTSQYYAIQSLEEAKAFLADPYLGRNLISICEALIKLESNDAIEIFGSPDNMKLQSCMTLFSLADNGNSVFDKVLEKYFDGQPDHRTLTILGKEAIK